MSNSLHLEVVIIFSQSIHFNSFKIQVYVLRLIREGQSEVKINQKDPKTTKKTASDQGKSEEIKEYLSLYLLLLFIKPEVQAMFKMTFLKTNDEIQKQWKVKKHINMFRVRTCSKLNVNKA